MGEKLGEGISPEEQAALDHEAEQQRIFAGNSEIAAQLLTREQPVDTTDIRELYRTHNENRQVEEVEFATGRDAVNAWFMSELLIGNQDSAIEFFYKSVDRVRDLPDDMKPDVAIVSGLVQGDFKFLQKPQRAELAEGLDSMDLQFKYARDAIEAVQEIGVPVIYNMSDDDRRVAEDYTIETFRNITELAQTQDGVNWAKVDKLRTHPEFQRHLKFQTDVVFPYCLSHGRRLKSAQEMYEATDGEIAIEEYFVLLGQAEAIAQGKRGPKAHQRWMKQSDEDRNVDVVIVDDANITAETDNRTRDFWIRHHMNFSPTPMYQNFMKNGAEALAQQVSHGKAAPDMLVTQNNLEEVGFGKQGSWIISTGGMIDAENVLHGSGRSTDVRGSKARRLMSTRRRIPSPSASMYELRDDGRMIATIMNDALTEKQFDLPERMTITEICDLQTGSITARPDIAVKYFDHMRTRGLGEQATAIFFGGDMLHGRNYPHFPSESQQTGLMSVDSQEAFNIAMMHASFNDMSASEIDALDRVLVQPGNHEWNSGTLKWHGGSFIKGVEGVFRELMLEGGKSKEYVDGKVTMHQAAETDRGEYLSGYTGIEKFGETNAIGVLIQHYLMERGGKGSGGDLPVYQTHHFANGAADLMKNIDIYMAGHWHHEQFGVFGDKLGIVGGAMAGISDYELKRGYRASIAGTMIHIGGGLPVQVEFIPEEFLHNLEIQRGDFTSKNLAEEGYTDDEGHDPHRHGIWQQRGTPRSAMQKKLRDMTLDASQHKGRISTF